MSFSLGKILQHLEDFVRTGIIVVEGIQTKEEPRNGRLKYRAALPSTLMFVCAPAFLKRFILCHIFLFNIFYVSYVLLYKKLLIFTIYHCSYHEWTDEWVTAPLFTLRIITYHRLISTTNSQSASFSSKIDYDEFVDWQVR